MADEQTKTGASGGSQETREAADSDSAQDDVAGNGPGDTFVEKEWIIRFAIAHVVIAILLLAGLWFAWPDCKYLACPPSDKPADAETGKAPFSISPAFGPSQRENDVTLTVADNGDFSGATKVQFGDSAVTLPVPAAAGTKTLQVKAPARDAGKVDVEVLLPPSGRTWKAVQGYTYKGEPPSIISVTPKSGASNRDVVVTIEGTGFVRPASVTFGGLYSPSVTVKSSTSIVARGPQRDAGVVDVVVMSGDGQRAEATGGFTYGCPMPTDARVLLLVVLAGALGGSLHGLTSFPWYVGNRKLVWSWVPLYFMLPFGGAVIAVVFYLIIRGGFYTPSSSSSESSFIIVALAALVGLFSRLGMRKLKEIAEAILTKEEGANKAGAPTAAPPSVKSVNPPKGPPSGGNQVTIEGSGFVAGLKVKFGDVELSEAKRESNSKIVINAPPHAKDEKVNVVVVNPDGKASAPVVYSYESGVSPPAGAAGLTVTALTPTLGSTAGGDPVAIVGTGFDPKAMVKFGENEATTVTVNSPTSITATTPERAPGEVEVKVTNPDNKTATAKFTYTQPEEG